VRDMTGGFRIGVIEVEWGWTDWFGLGFFFLSPDFQKLSTYRRGSPSAVGTGASADERA